jgi:hypothetical protein
MVLSCNLGKQGQIVMESRQVDGDGNLSLLLSVVLAERSH